jgi:DNA modification methylase
MVHHILYENRWIRYVLEPFSGTGTTGLVCGEHGLTCDLLDINPFLIWFAKVKTANYTDEDCFEAREIAQAVVSQLKEHTGKNDLWLPPIKNIERWWPADKRILLAQINHELNERMPSRAPVKDLLLIAFCRILIEWSNAAFNHQSMSFKQTAPSLFSYSERENLLLGFIDTVSEILHSAKQFIPGQVRAILSDSRSVPEPEDRLYDCVITSPPYPNRMSYIRELRPYMYWLGYLQEAREAGELDWQAIGGTWGIATSRVEKWQPDGASIEYKDFYRIIKRIDDRSRVLANYVHKYFVDILAHLISVRRVLNSGAKVFYIVGNSKFYDTIVPVEEIYAKLLEQAGFERARVEILRRRSSKKELRESVVSAVKP